MKRMLDDMSAPLPEAILAFWEHARELFCVLNAKGEFVEANPAWTRVLGYDHELLIGRRAVDLLAEGEQAATASAVLMPATGNV